jgi:hypothetical protein
MSTAENQALVHRFFAEVCNYPIVCANPRGTARENMPQSKKLL